MAARHRLSYRQAAPPGRHSVKRRFGTLRCLLAIFINANHSSIDLDRIVPLPRTQGHNGLLGMPIRKRLSCEGDFNNCGPVMWPQMRRIDDASDVEAESVLLTRRGNGPNVCCPPMVWLHSLIQAPVISFKSKPKNILPVPHLVRSCRTRELTRAARESYNMKQPRHRGVE